MILQNTIDKLTSALGLPPSEKMEPGVVCTVTGKPISYGYAFYNYKKVDYISELAGCFLLPSIDRLGIEREAKGTAIGYALCKIAGAKIIVHQDDKPIEIWTGGKYLDRLKTEYFTVVNATGNLAKKKLLEYPVEGMVFEMSLRMERVLKQIRASTLKQKNLITETGVISLPIENWQPFVDKYKSLDKKSKKEFLQLAKTIINGKKNLLDGGVQKSLEDSPIFFEMLHLLPSLPHAAMYYLQAITVESV